MIKALLLIFDPVQTWERIVESRRGVLTILALFLLPLLVLTSAGEACGLSGGILGFKWPGPARLGAMGRSTPPGMGVHDLVVFEGLQFVLSLVVVFVGAWLLKSLGQTFHSRNTFKQAFTAVAYGLSPLFLLRLINAFSWLSPWVPWVVWTIGLLLSLGTLYHGVPKALEPDPPQAFGIFLSSAILLVLITGLERFLTFWCLQGRFPALKAIFPA